jgi:hypothetical protein
MTRDELLMEARKRKIPNSSQMNKLDLADALKRYDAINDQALGEVGG